MMMNMMIMDVLLMFYNLSFTCDPTSVNNYR